MVRKTREDALATRDALLTAALQTFRERGVAHTRLSDVAARAGVTRGAIYWHFKDKAELFAAVCERGTLPVEALLAGEEDGLNAVLTACRRGPPLALVTSIEEHFAEPPEEPGFTRRASL